MVSICLAEHMDKSGDEEAVEREDYKDTGNCNRICAPPVNIFYLTLHSCHCCSGVPMLNPPPHT